ncbi:MAG: hypothetical protein JWO50_813 [Candidatus Kaiserbacteria bacterium]|nr:hypothetical protein [Candidatus Kaiserbacteria bacterium]
MKILYTYARALIVPVGLVIIFVIQNLIFNNWVHLDPNPENAIFVFDCAIFGVLLYMPGILCRGIWRFIYYLCVSVILSAIFISQYLYFSFYGGFLQASALRYANQLGDETSTLIKLVHPSIVVFLLGVLGVAIAYWITRSNHLHVPELGRRQKLNVAVVLLCTMIGWYGFFVPSDVQGLRKFTDPQLVLHDLNSFSYSPNQTVREIGISSFYLEDLIGTFMRKTVISSVEKDFVKNWFNVKPPITKEANFGLLKGDNFIIIQVESLEASVIGQTIGGEEITPNLNKLAHDGLYFKNYYTQVGPGNTADAEFVTLNSLYPLTNTVAFIDYANNSYAALPNLLVQNGYSTFALHGDIANFWNRTNIYPGLGYQTSINKADFTVKETDFESLSDDDFLQQSAVKMQTFTQPFMATVITLSSHTPFQIPQRFQTLNIPDDANLTDTQKDYLQSVHYADSALGMFIQSLKSEGLYDNSLIAIYGDHGGSTGISEVVGTSTYHTVTPLLNSHVPLILLSPKLNTLKHGTIDTPGSHLDLYPTVANLLGILPPNTVLGQDLLNTKTPVITHRDPYSEIILSIMTPSLLYESSASGIFEEGTCETLPQNTMLPIADCSALYEQQSTTIRVSDDLVRGNLLNLVLKNSSQ